MTTSDREVVAALEQAIRQRIGEPRYNLWFAGHTKLVFDAGLLTVGVPNRHFQEWLNRTFRAEVQSAAQEVFGEVANVRFVIDPALFQAARKEQERVQAQPELAQDEPSVERVASAAESTRLSQRRTKPTAEAEQTREEPLPRKERSTSKRRWRKLPEFVVGPCNRVAYASALSVAEAPGEGPIPLVLHGPVGTGKSHLLEGIYAELRRRQPQSRVVFVTAEDFTNRFVQAMRLGKLSTFRKHFREVDALLVDDLHFLASKKATQEEFLHTFNALQSEGTALVVTCDCHPRLADELAPEVIDRLLGGAVWGLQPPEYETRLAILRSKALMSMDTLISENVLCYLAEQLRGNVRELEGALHSVRHYGRVMNRPIDLALANEAVGELLRHSVRLVQMPDIDQAVCKVLQLEHGALQAKQRAWAVSHPRMIAMFLSRKHTSSAYSEVGKFFGGRNHSTAVAAEKKVRQWLQKDEELALGERRVRVREVLELIERLLLR